MKPSTGAPVRNRRNAVRDQLECLSAIDWNRCPRSLECCIVGLFKHLSARHYHNWGLLTQALQTGAPQSRGLAKGYSALYSETGTQEMFVAGMTAGSLLAAQALAVKFPWKRYRTFVDVGTAQ